MTTTMLTSKDDKTVPVKQITHISSASCLRVPLQFFKHGRHFVSQMLPALEVVKLLAVNVMQKH